jgi:hypothetical protein
MELNAWTSALRAIYDKAVALYLGGNRKLDAYFTADETAVLASIGLKPINVYDYAEDFAGYGEPDWETALLIASARRDFFLFEQHGAPSPAETPEDALPPKPAELDGIPWLPRLIAKARCFLHGSLCHDIMYCCGGDRRFFKEYGIHPADFLRAVWGAHDDDAKIVKFVRSGAGAAAA